MSSQSHHRTHGDPHPRPPRSQFTTNDSWLVIGKNAPSPPTSPKNSGSNSADIQLQQMPVCPTNTEVLGGDQNQKGPGPIRPPDLFADGTVGVENAKSPPAPDSIGARLKRLVNGHEPEPQRISKKHQGKRGTRGRGGDFSPINTPSSAGAEKVADFKLVETPSGSNILVGDDSLSTYSISGTSNASSAPRERSVKRGNGSGSAGGDNNNNSGGSGYVVAGGQGQKSARGPLSARKTRQMRHANVCARYRKSDKTGTNVVSTWLVVDETGRGKIECAETMPKLK